jgi:hypothetical protein
MKNSTTTNTEDVADITVTKKRAPRTKKVIAPIIEEEEESVIDSFVFMDKTLALLDIGIKTGKNIVLYGPGGHGKSELALEFFLSKGINPYIITMGTGMTTERLFGGIELDKLNEGKIEYLVENSFMNHEYVIFEEMMDAPDFILEQLKDILSRGEFRNGSQVYPIKTRYIVCNTNRTREEFAKNDSIKALMERFPLEHNVVWDNYTEIAYNTLLEKRFGKGRVDPTIPFILQEYVKAGINISPRIALDCYSVYETCGPDSLIYIAEFARKPEIIKEALKKFEATIKFKETGVEISELIKTLTGNAGGSAPLRFNFIKTYRELNKKVNEVKKMVVNDDMASVLAALIKGTSDVLAKNKNSFDQYVAQEKKSKEPAQSDEIEEEYINAPSF